MRFLAEHRRQRVPVSLSRNAIVLACSGWRPTLSA
jgi:hypothetical protein